MYQLSFLFILASALLVFGLNGPKNLKVVSYSSQCVLSSFQRIAVLYLDFEDVNVEDANYILFASFSSSMKDAIEVDRYFIKETRRGIITNTTGADEREFYDAVTKTSDFYVALKIELPDGTMSDYSNTAKVDFSRLDEIQCKGNLKDTTEFINVTTSNLRVRGFSLDCKDDGKAVGKMWLKFFDLEHVSDQEVYFSLSSIMTNAELIDVNLEETSKTFAQYGTTSVWYHITTKGEGAFFVALRARNAFGSSQYTNLAKVDVEFLPQLDCKQGKKVLRKAQKETPRLSSSSGSASSSDGFSLRPQMIWTSLVSVVCSLFFVLF